MNADSVIGLLGGGLIGILLGVVIMASGGTMAEYREAKTTCEKNLPRNQVCVMYFKPEEK